MLAFLLSQPLRGLDARSWSRIIAGFYFEEWSRSTVLLCLRHPLGRFQYEAFSVLGQGGRALRPQLAGDLEPPGDLPPEVPLPEVLRVSKLRYEALRTEQRDVHLRLRRPTAPDLARCIGPGCRANRPGHGRCSGPRGLGAFESRSRTLRKARWCSLAGSNLVPYLTGLLGCTEV